MAFRIEIETTEFLSQDEIANEGVILLGVNYKPNWLAKASFAYSVKYEVINEQAFNSLVTKYAKYANGFKMTRTDSNGAKKVYETVYETAGNRGYIKVN